MHDQWTEDTLGTARSCRCCHHALTSPSVFQGPQGCKLSSGPNHQPRKSPSDQCGHFPERIPTDGSDYTHTTTSWTSPHIGYQWAPSGCPAWEVVTQVSCEEWATWELTAKDLLLTKAAILLSAVTPQADPKPSQQTTEDQTTKP